MTDTGKDTEETWTKLSAATDGIVDRLRIVKEPRGNGRGENCEHDGREPEEDRQDVKGFDAHQIILVYMRRSR